VKCSLLIAVGGAYFHNGKQLVACDGADDGAVLLKMKSRGKDSPFDGGGPQ
jgi:hypothetical protein